MLFSGYGRDTGCGYTNKAADACASLTTKAPDDAAALVCDLQKWWVGNNGPPNLWFAPNSSIWSEGLEEQFRDPK